MILNFSLFWKKSGEKQNFSHWAPSVNRLRLFFCILGKKFLNSSFACSFLSNHCHWTVIESLFLFPLQDPPIWNSFPYVLQFSKCRQYNLKNHRTALQSFAGSSPVHGELSENSWKVTFSWSPNCSPGVKLLRLQSLVFEAILTSPCEEEWSTVPKNWHPVRSRL